jgi:8-oxo-dGTP pyrophosphatase MutT (NUDIX family)
MTRQHLLDALRTYQPADAREEGHRAALEKLLNVSKSCFYRSRLAGHITASAWVIAPAEQRVLLMHHRKLDRWLQPGGHADGDENLAGVALREAHEESGLCSLRLLKPTIFDIDVHTIPTRANEPEHLHYDVRYLLTADANEKINYSLAESKGFAWVNWSEVGKKTGFEASMVRLVEKTENLYQLSA